MNSHNMIMLIQDRRATIPRGGWKFILDEGLLSLSTLSLSFLHFDNNFLIFIYNFRIADNSE